MSRRRHQAEEHENAERWLLTYADMITLLMAFFIMLYSMSQLDIKKFADMKGSVQAELGSRGMLKGSTAATEAALMPSGSSGIIPQLGLAASFGLKQALERELAPLAKSAGLGITLKGQDVKVTLPATTLMFPSGKADLSPTMKQLLQKLAAVIARRRCMVKVTGHTCNLPVHNEKYSSNWELSADRARNVAFYLIRQGVVSAADCSFMGLADTQSLAPNTSELNRRRNRRVEISLRPRDEPSAPDSAASTRAPARAAPPHIDLCPHLENVGRQGANNNEESK